MMVLTIDLETYLITPECLTPRIVCATYKTDGVAVLETRDENGGFKVYDVIEKHLENPDAVLIGHNVSFDLACLVNERPAFLPVVFGAYDNGQIRDTMVGDQLLGIAAGAFEKRKSSLAACAKRYLNIEMTGKTGDAWRFKYAELDGIPEDQWPAEAVRYAVQDVKNTELVFYHLNGAVIQNWREQCYAAWALHLISVYGMRINEDRADDWLSTIEAEFLEARAYSKKIGILRPNDTKNMSVLREFIAEAYDGKPPLTDKGSIKTDVETLKHSGDERLVKYADGRFCEKLWTTYAPILQGSRIVRPRYNVLVKSGRTSCSKPNMQNPPRGGGFREVFEPRPGYVFALCDYDQIELVALSQIHLWLFETSALADAVNEGRDLHLEVAAKLNPDDPKSYRQASKAANYGFAGGLGAEAFRNYAKGLGLDISEDDAKDIRAAWLKTWPEMKKYFSYISRATTWGGADVEQFVSRRVRGSCSFTQYANTLFQGLVADAAKSALTAVCRACYIEFENPLFGSRPVAFLHDEIIIETPEENAASAADELSRIMIEEMRRYIPDVKVGASAYLSTLWSKKADAVYNDAGELIPWTK
jgi:DNA polymerase-1